MQHFSAPRMHFEACRNTALDWEVLVERLPTHHWAADRQADVAQLRFTGISMP